MKLRGNQTSAVNVDTGVEEIYPEYKPLRQVTSHLVNKHDWTWDNIVSWENGSESANQALQFFRESHMREHEDIDDPDRTWKPHAGRRRMK